MLLKKVKNTFLQLKNGAHMEIDLQLEQEKHGKKNQDREETQESNHKGVGETVIIEKQKFTNWECKSQFL